MLAKRVIPTILSKNGQQVKGKGFNTGRVIGKALQAARTHAVRRGVDELMILDVTATKDGRDPDYDMIKALSERCYMPITAGGGVKTEEHVRGLLNAGADKVCIGSAATDLKLVKSLSDKFGRQCITISYDIKSNLPNMHRYNIDTLIEYGAGEILLQSVTNDGTMNGYDLEMIKLLSDVSVPVIASGGCSGYEDMKSAIDAGADAVAAGALFAFTDSTPIGAVKYLHRQGVEVRL